MYILKFVNSQTLNLHVLCTHITKLNVLSDLTAYSYIFTPFSARAMCNLFFYIIRVVPKLCFSNNYAGEQSEQGFKGCYSFCSLLICYMYV